jgi:hypothetical protein
MAFKMKKKRLEGRQSRKTLFQADLAPAEDRAVRLVGAARRRRFVSRGLGHALIAVSHH